MLKNENNFEKIWIQNWVDHTSIYGFGYILSNGLIGLNFNDGTKIIMKNNCCEIVIYIAKEGKKHAHIEANSMSKMDFSENLE